MGEVPKFFEEQLEMPPQFSVEQPEQPQSGAEVIAQPELVLEASDAEKIELGLGELWDFLSQKEADQLPGMVLYPETANRPIAHGASAVFRDVYRSKGVPPPIYFFIYEQTARAGKWLDTAYRMLEEEYGIEASGNDVLWQAYIKPAAEDLDKARGLLKQRLAEVLAVAERLKLPKRALIVEEYVIQGRTVSAMRQVMRDLDKSVSTEAFAFLASSEGRDPERHVYAPLVDMGNGKTPQRATGEGNLLIGTSTDGYLYRGKGKTDKVGFDKGSRYMGGGEVFLELPETPYATPVQPFPPQARAIRREIRAIGERVVENKKSDLSSN